MRPKKPIDGAGKRRKFRSRISKPGTATAPKATKAPNAPEAHKMAKAFKPQRKLDKWERLEQRYAELHATAGTAIDQSMLVDDRSTETNPTEATLAKAKPEATVPKSNVEKRSLPPRMAKKIKAAIDQADELKQCPKWVQKEFARLNALVSKLTGSKDKAKPKVLYFDENWLAARWGMSLKHIRNLRAAGVGPKVTYFGRSVRYRLREVVAFEKANAFASPTDRDQSR